MELTDNKVGSNIALSLILGGYLPHTMIDINSEIYPSLKPTDMTEFFT